jgi:1,4-dihydroxy-2-naphthoate octaprenyltransferase
MKAWLAAARLRTLPLAMAGILLGVIPVGGEEFEWNLTFFLCLLTAITLQILSNFANDYGDTQNGADHFRTNGPSRAVQSGAISPQRMKFAIVVSAILSIGLGITLLWISLWQQGWTLTFFIFLAIGLTSVAAAYYYTAGKKPYGYIGLGDLSVFVFFGLAAVIGSHFLMYKHFDFVVFLLATMQGLFSVMVLHLNNMRDFHDDEKAAKKTMAIRLGWILSKWYFVCLSLSSVSIFTFLAIHFQPYLLLMVGLIIVIFLSIFPSISRSENAKEIDAQLKKVALSSFFISIVLFLNSII